MFIELLLFIVAFIIIWIAARIYIQSTFVMCKSEKDMSGLTVIVTGANSGIGLETARDLARRNARVILACRDQVKGQQALQSITSSTGNTNVVLKKLDLSSFKSTRAFADDILETESRLDVLINNAGVLTVIEPTKTEDGFEIIMATNHYGPFLLTLLLLPLLKKSAPSRIVVVSSVIHNFSYMDFNNLNGERFFISLEAYGRSKLANVLFTIELASRLANTGVTVNALHPGIICTGIVRHWPWILNIMIEFIVWPMRRTIEQGSQSTIYLAVAEDLEKVSGKYFSECKERSLLPHARNRVTAKRLWEHTEEATGVYFSGISR